MPYKKPTITVVVPVYNVEKYIIRCLESIIRQTYDDFECLIIDDASSDSSIMLGKSRIEKDGKFRIISHQKNSGSGTARNTGIENAQGEYICFIDSDDYIEKDYLKLLYQTITKHNAAICTCNIYYGKENDKRIISANLEVENWIEAIEKILNGIDGGSSCNRLYKRKLFDKVKYVNGYYEDVLVNIHLMLENKVSYIPFINQPLYHYVTREGSSTQGIDTIRIKDFIHNAFICSKHLLIKYDQYKYYKKLFCENFMLIELKNIIHQTRKDTKNISTNLKTLKKCLQNPILQEEIQYIHQYLSNNAVNKIKYLPCFMLFYTSNTFFLIAYIMLRYVVINIISYLRLKSIVKKLMS